MTDTITPASTFTAEEWRAGERIARANGFIGEADHYAAQAARLEAESARDEEARKYAMKLGAQARLAFATVKGSLEEVNLAAGEHILAVLAADGRLLPEGGTDCEDEHDDTGWREEIARKWRDASASARRSEHHFPADCLAEAVEMLNRGALTPPAVPVPDSGPDGTPEKPWPTWQDVPEGVEVMSSKYAHLERTIKANGRCYYAIGALTDVDVADRAPFVRVDGDKA